MQINGHEVRADVTYTPAEASNILGVKVGTLAAYRCGTNIGPAYLKIGRKVLYRGSDLLRFVDTSVRTSNLEHGEEGQ